QELFGDNAVLINYATPGIELGLALKHKLDQCKTLPQIIFLKNHGLIISAKTSKEIITLQEEVLSTVETYLKLDFSIYKKTNQISEIYNQITGEIFTSYLSEDQIIAQFIKKNYPLLCSATTPDFFVYNHTKACRLRNLDLSELIDFRNKNGFLPKVLILD